MTRPSTVVVRIRTALSASIALLAVTLVAVSATSATATDQPDSVAGDEALQLGAEVYSRSCSSCHQPGGAGLPGQFPPLVDNPNIDDAAYVEDVIVNGQQGEIEVGGERYDGVMPPFSTLSDDEVAAVIAYLQNDLMAPQAAIDAFDSEPAPSGIGIPRWVGVTALVVALAAAAVAAVAMAPRVIRVNDRLSTPRLDAWSKTVAIVLVAVMLTVVVPNLVLRTGGVSRLSRFWQDAIGSGLWVAGLTVLLVGLWWAHRESRI